MAGRFARIDTPRRGTEPPRHRAKMNRVGMQEMVIYGVSFDLGSKQPIVLLKTADGNRFLPIWIGHPEAAAILMKLQGASTPRPMTHDLVTDMLDQLDAQVVRITVTELKESTFYASITVQQNGSEVEIDSRPSDAIALAVRADAPIFAADDVIEESAIEFEHEVEDTEEVVDKFKEFLDNVRIDLFPDEVYVFTPRGDVKALPEGATPVDFAYAVHTDVGHHCVGAKVNGKLVPLRYTLRQGDILEIVTSPTQHPSRDWLKIVKSNRARAKINQWLKIEERARSLALGRELFEREAKKYRLSPATVLASDEMKKVVSELGFPSADDLLASIGYGKTSLQQVLGRVAPSAVRDTEAATEAKPARAARKGDGPAVRIRGVDDLLVRFAKCCTPLPGDPIVGFITRGRGLTVHSRDCLTVARSVLDRERLIEVEWDVAEPAKRPVRVAVYIGADRPGLLSEITGAISSRNGNITKAEVTVTDDRKGINHFVIEVEDLQQLQGIMQGIREVKDIVNVERVRGL